MVLIVYPFTQIFSWLPNDRDIRLLIKFLTVYTCITFHFFALALGEKGVFCIKISMLHFCKNNSSVIEIKTFRWPLMEQQRRLSKEIWWMIPIPDVMALSAEWCHLFHDVILTAMWRYLPFLYNFREVLYVWGKNCLIYCLHSH
jgi:hypothetical protein